MFLSFVKNEKLMPLTGVLTGILALVLNVLHFFVLGDMSAGDTTFNFLVHFCVGLGLLLF